MRRVLPMLLPLLAAIPAAALDRSDCARIEHLGMLYSLRAVLAGSQTTSRDVEQWVDQRVEELREPVPGGGYRWVRYVRPSGDGPVDKHVHKVRAVYDSEDPDLFEATGRHVYAVRVVVPSKRSLFKGNHPVYVGDVRIAHHEGNGLPVPEVQHIHRWMHPDTSQSLDLKGIHDFVTVTAPLATGKRDRGESVAEIHFSAAVAQDDPANPRYAAIRSLLRIRDTPDPATVEGEIAALERTLFPGLETFPVLTVLRDLRRARDLMASEKSEDQEKGSKLLKETLGRLR